MTGKGPLVIKLGGSVITNKRRRFTINQDVLERIVGELKSAEESLVVIHGGGSFGHPLAAEYNIASGHKERRQLMGFSLTHQAMEVLNSKVVETFQDAGFLAISVQPSACVVTRNSRIDSFDIKGLRGLLELGLLPILYGDTVFDLELGMSILSGDQLAVYLARELSASRVIIGTDTNGVYVEGPVNEGEVRFLPKITPEDWERIADSLGSASTTDVTGGMKKKVEELLNLKGSGIEAQIVNLLEPGTLKRVVQGDKSLGTTILGE